jgi:hypothetical protein
MPKQDWKTIITTINTKSPTYLKNFLASNEVFCPNRGYENVFDPTANAFSSKHLNKPKPANWIPIYKRDDLSDYLLENGLMPVRCGQGEFFFYRGEIVFDLREVEQEEVAMETIESVEWFVPLTLQRFHRNENAYLNRALALGVLNHFLDSRSLDVFEEKIVRADYRRLLYGQFGKIKTNFELEFKTTKGSRPINRGFQFEMDLVLENEDEIIIFEAKQGSKARENFVLLQLYYPLVYLSTITQKQKRIRTIFIDIESKEQEVYRLTEFCFCDGCFDEVEVLKSVVYWS